MKNTNIEDSVDTFEKLDKLHTSLSLINQVTRDLLKSQSVYNNLDDDASQDDMLDAYMDLMDEINNYVPILFTAQDKIIEVVDSLVEEHAANEQASKTKA